MRLVACFALAFLALLRTADAGEKSVRVFVALCDNKTQGIVKVGEKIGDGDVPEANLYWGCDDGFGSYFKRSKRWKVTGSEEDVSREVMRRMTLRHIGGDVTLVADAYRGSEIRKCMEDFEKALASGEYDLVAFIGHNGLMEFRYPLVKPVEGNDTDAIILCCVSQKYFAERLTVLKCRPVLMTDQLMYPGSFLLHDALDVWRDGGSAAEIRTSAGRSYARNQKVSVRAGTGVFTQLGEGK